jgi:broad specificity phosphatase PhoE
MWRTWAALAWFPALIVMGLPADVAMAQSVPSMVILVRHGEVGGGPAGDPALNDAGRERAQALATALHDAGIATIITSSFRRTRETAQPLARALGLSPVAVPVSNDLATHIAALAAAVRSGSRGAVLVVGHSETVPALIGMLGGPRIRNLCETTFDRLFVLVPGQDRMLLARARYGEASVSERPDCP